MYDVFNDSWSGFKEKKKRIEENEGKQNVNNTMNATETFTNILTDYL